jgi:hypothetical protein
MLLVPADQYIKQQKKKKKKKEKRKKERQKSRMRLLFKRAASVKNPTP